MQIPRHFSSFFDASSDFAPQDTVAETFERHHPYPRRHNRTPANVANMCIIGLDHSQFHVSSSFWLCKFRGWNAPRDNAAHSGFSWIRSCPMICFRQLRNCRCCRQPPSLGSTLLRLARRRTTGSTSDRTTCNPASLLDRRPAGGDAEDRVRLFVYAGVRICAFDSNFSLHQICRAWLYKVDVRHIPAVRLNFVRATASK